MDIVYSPSRLGKHGINKLIKNGYIISGNDPEQGKHAQVFLVKTPQKNTRLAIKRQLVDSPLNSSDRAYRELRILKELAGLYEKFQCDNFVFLVDWFKVHPPLLPEGYNETSSQESSKVASTPMKSLAKTPKSTSKVNVESLLDIQPQYLHMVMECVDNTLYQQSKKGISILEYKSILFEILLALSIAQQELQFVHNDLHLKNILLKRLPSNVFRTHKDHSSGKIYHTYGFIVKICDFGNSKIKIRRGPTDYDVEVICNSKDVLSETDVNHNSADVSNFALGFNKIKITDWMNMLDQKIEEERKLISDMKKKLNKGVLPKLLLGHSLFDSLKEIPDHDTYSLMEQTPLKKPGFMSPIISNINATPKRSSTRAARTPRSMVKSTSKTFKRLDFNVDTENIDPLVNALGNLSVSSKSSKEESFESPKSEVQSNPTTVSTSTPLRSSSRLKKANSVAFAVQSPASLRTPLFSRRRDNNNVNS